MIRTFTEAELDEMCKKRPPDYRADIMAVAAPRAGQPGTYEFDSASAAYSKLLSKYSARMPVDGGAYKSKFQHRRPHNVRQQVVPGLGTGPNGLKAVSYDMLVDRVDRVLAVMGAQSPFTAGYAEFKVKKDAGGCRGCGRGKVLARLFLHFKNALMVADMDVRRQVREVFQDTDCLEYVPVVLKWDDIVKPAG